MDGDDSRRARQRDLVRRGYDAISLRYRDDDATSADYRAWIQALGATLRAGARVLDLGCGNGVPAARLLTEAGFAVTGLDLSDVQIARARTLVPAAEFIVGDMVTWDAGSHEFDAIVCLYALIHVPLSDQRALIPRLARWLQPGGSLLAIVGHERWSGVEDYLGAPMFWDHADAATSVTWFEDAGFAVDWHRFVPDGDDTGHTLLLAHAPSS